VCVWQQLVNRIIARTSKHKTTSSAVTTHSRNRLVKVPPDWRNVWRDTCGATCVSKCSCSVEPSAAERRNRLVIASRDATTQSNLTTLLFTRALIIPKRRLRGKRTFSRDTFAPGISPRRPVLDTVCTAWFAGRCITRSASIFNVYVILSCRQ